MNPGDKRKELEQCFTDQLVRLIDQRSTSNEPRTYGFEYEFISTRPLDPETMERLYGLLPECGFLPGEEGFSHPSGMIVTFEPGGQIEYQSPPLRARDDFMMEDSLQLIEETNQRISRKLHIEYMATGYIPGRGGAPLCLKAKRYQDLHARMPKSGPRGLEMMKGTASIHLHARICDSRELPPLYHRIRQIALMEEFKMGSDRRDIWNHTDPVRCGLPYRVDKHSNARQVVAAFVRFALNADDIGKNIPFYKTDDLSFAAFQYHQTTIFTDVRLNIKGPSIELRTLDSMPFLPFKEKWKKFIHMLQNISIYCNE